MESNNHHIILLFIGVVLAGLMAFLFMTTSGELFLTAVKGGKGGSDDDSSSITATGTGRAATFVVAASNASALMKSQADYVADGVNDNIEIQAAINALPAVGGKIVLSEGTFNVTNAILMKQAVILEGQGTGWFPFDGSQGGTVLNKSYNGPVIIAINANAWGLEYLTIFGNKALYLGDGIQVKGGDLSPVTNISSGQPRQWWLLHVNIVGTRGVGIKAVDSGYHWLTNVDIRDTDGHGIELIRTPDWFWTSISIGGAGESAGAPSDGAHIGRGSVGIITGSKFWQNYRGIYGETGLSIRSSEFEKNRLHGWEIAGSDSQSVGNLYERNNTSDDALGAAILISNRSRNVIVGNQILDPPQGTLYGKMRYGIREIGPAANDNVITGNRISGARTAAISVNGANTIVRNNSGYVTESSGTATINSTAKSVAVGHGLDTTPVAGDCWFIGAENPKNPVGTLWIDTYTQTQMRLNVENSPGVSNFDVNWSCRVK